MVIKPSELTPYSALALCVLAERAGLPAGAGARHLDEGLAAPGIGRRRFGRVLADADRSAELLDADERPCEPASEHEARGGVSLGLERLDGDVLGAAVLAGGERRVDGGERRLAAFRPPLEPQHQSGSDYAEDRDDYDGVNKTHRPAREGGSRQTPGPNVNRVWSTRTTSPAESC